jgi:hypothetical protein
MPPGTRRSPRSTGGRSAAPRAADHRAYGALDHGNQIASDLTNRGDAMRDEWDVGTSVEPGAADDPPPNDYQPPDDVDDDSWIDDVDADVLAACEADAIDDAEDDNSWTDFDPWDECDPEDERDLDRSLGEDWDED